MNFKKAYDGYVGQISVTLKPTTVLFITRGFKKHILPSFETLDINDITINDINAWQQYILSLNFSDSFNYNIQTMLKKFFDYLTEYYGFRNLLSKNNYIQSFKPQEKKELNVWTIKDFNKFIKVVDNKIYHALFDFLFFTGCRKGEALCLRFSDIEDNYVSISKTITKELFNNKHLEMKPKTKKSIRKIRIDRKLKNEIKKLKKYYSTIYTNFNNDFYVFGGIKSISCTTLKRKKDEYCRLAHVKQIKIHDFRHSHATMLYNKNIQLKTIQARLGHASITTTADTYVHENKKQEKRVMQTLNLLRFKI